MIFSNYLKIFLLMSSVSNVFCQVCSSIGKMCHRTTDCCNGCCEAYICEDRSFSCSGDMIAQPGSNTCASVRCPPDHICYLREVCPEESPCPRLPSCRRVNLERNYTDYRYYRNSSPTSVLLFTQSPLAISCILLSTLHQVYHSNEMK